MPFVPKFPSTRDVFTRAKITRTAMVLERTRLRSVYGFRGGSVFIGSKAILGSLANESPRWLAALACPPLRPAATFTGSLALLGSPEVLLSTITMWLTISVAQTDLNLEVDGAIKDDERPILNAIKKGVVWLGLTRDNHLDTSQRTIR